MRSAAQLLRASVTGASLSRALFAPLPGSLLAPSGALPLVCAAGKKEFSKAAKNSASSGLAKKLAEEIQQESEYKPDEVRLPLILTSVKPTNPESFCYAFIHGLSIQGLCTRGRIPRMLLLPAGFPLSRSFPSLSFPLSFLFLSLPKPKPIPTSPCPLSSRGPASSI
jgi:hypothetical protein